MIYHVKGNRLALAIELTLRTVEADGTNIEQTDVDFVPVGDVDVTLQSGARRWNYKFQARNSVVEFIDTGELPVGEYDIELFCRDLQGNRYRWKYRDLLTVVDCSEEAGVEQPVEFQTTAYSLQGVVTPLGGGGGGISEETDPVFCASPAAGITQADIDRWDAGCGLAEIDPIFSYSPAARITNEDILRWNSGSDIHTIKKNGYPLYPDSSGSIDISGVITEVMVNGEYVPIASDGQGNCLLVLQIPEGEGTVVSVKMNNGTPIEPDEDGVVNLGTVITQHQDISGKANSADLSVVATSGSYNDLTDKPNIPTVVTVDSTITQNGTNPVQGGAIYSALAEKEKYISYDDENELLSDTSQPHGTIGYEFENESFYFWDATNDEWRRILDAEDYAVLTDRFVPKTRTVNGKALSSNITLNASDVGAQSVINDLATIRSGAAAGATALQPSDVSVETPSTPDGTFELNVGSDTYTVNLNHEHPEYAPLVHTHSQYALVQVVNGESSLPATLDPKTIYGVKADGVDELEMVVIGGYKFYGGGGGAPGQPVLMQPAAGSTISMGTVDNGYGGSTLDPKSKSVNIKARNITQPISVSVSGTGFSIENSVSQISAADAIAGTTINVLFDGSSGSQGGTLLLQSTDFGQVPLSVDLAVDYVTYEALGAVGLRGSQWIQTDYIANPNTNIKLVTKFTPNSNTRQTGTIGCVFDSRKNGTRVVSAYFGGNNAENNAGTYLLNLATDGGVVKGSYYQQFKFFTAANTPDNSFCNKGTLNYSGTSASFNNKSITIVRQTTTADHGMTIGINDVADAAPMNAFDVDIYSLEITESGTTVRNYVPIKKSGVPGLYDTVHGTFHSSETDTPLAEVAATT